VGAPFVSETADLSSQWIQKLFTEPIRSVGGLYRRTIKPV